MGSQSDYFKKISANATSLVKIKISKYMDNRKLMGCIPEKIFIEMLSSKSPYYHIDSGVLADIELEYKRRTESEKILNKIVSFNNRGISNEKNGELKKAISEYEKCLECMYENYELGYVRQIAWHSPDRLRILYKKEKHPNEKEFLETFISFCERNSIEIPEAYLKQLDKIN